MGVSFAFNCYRHWAQLLLCQPSDAPVILLSQEGVTHCDPLSMVLYGVTLAPLVEDIRAADPTLLSPFYANDAAFHWSARQSSAQLRLVMDRGPNRG